MNFLATEIPYDPVIDSTLIMGKMVTQQELTLD